MDIRDQTLILVEIQDQILFTRPDIIFAEHQVASFTNAPMKRHATTFKMIIRYMARTHDTGIIISSFFGGLFLRCYVDANFANLFQLDC